VIDLLAVRLPSGNWYALQVDKEQRWLPVLAPQLPLPIPTPVAKGAPDSGFPYPWSVYRWLDGDLLSKARIGDLTGLATALAGFLNALGRVDATGGPGARTAQLLPRRPAGYLRGRGPGCDRRARR
jgi:aminoglycoside phosphotransferase (APT) family kinase protein